MIATICTILFWAAAGVLLYVYIGYPIVLFAIASVVKKIHGLRRGVQPADTGLPKWPAVSMIIPAYNEADVIREKLDNCLELDYPRDKLEVIVASDGSTDGTPGIVQEYVGRGVTFIDYPERSGKAAVLNRMVPRTTHGIVIMSDANTIYDPQAIKHLVKHFAGDRVGAVVGEMTLHSLSREHRGEVRYWRYEVALKTMENTLGAILGANGGLYAIRKELFEPIPENAMHNDDFLIPLRIAERGWRQVYSPEARATEPTARDVKAEAVRKVRIAAGNFQSITMLWRLLNPLRGWIAFTFFSHKILRWVAPFFMIIALASNVPLALHTRFYAALLGLQVAFYVAAAAGACAPPWPSLRRLCAVPYYFVSMNVAMFRGFLGFLLCTQEAAWKKIERK